MMTFEDYLIQEGVEAHTMSKGSAVKTSYAFRQKARSDGGVVHHHEVNDDGDHKIVHTDKKGNTHWS